MDLNRFAINQITTPGWTLEQAIIGYARQGVSGIGIWRDKLAECGLARARKALKSADSWVPSLCKTGNIAEFEGSGHKTVLDDCYRAIEEAAEICAPCVVFVCGGIGPNDETIEKARGNVSEVLYRACEFAVEHGVHIGIEPFHPMHAADRGCINTLAQAHRICSDCGPAARVVLDVFHVWWDPDLYRYLEPPFVANIISVQLCDWRVPTRHPVEDRAMPGDGKANVRGIVKHLEDHDYTGPYEIEIFSQDWWRKDPDEVVRACVDRYTSIFNDHSMTKGID